MSASFSAHSVRARRAGISLLEIMISIGVVGIGLIGVAAMIPLAHHKAAQGVQEDRKALYGKRAFREFRVRGMDRWENLYSPMDDPLKEDIGIWRSRPICLDPLMVARGQTTFPSGGTGVFATLRVSLINKDLEEWRLLMGLSDPTRAVMGWSEAEAREVLRLRDDLHAARPDDSSLPVGLQYVDLSEDTSPSLYQMESTGDYSWIATLVPDQRLGGEMYTVSIVVFFRRKLDLASPEEITAQVAVANLSGPIKNVGLTPASPQLTDFGWDKLAADNWILLAVVDPTAPKFANIVDMKWYRILMASEQNGTFDVTLDGPDWNVSQAAGVGLYAISLQGVVAVYEKTVRMHDSSLYAK